MIEVRPVESVDLPDLAPYRTMKRPEEHRERGIFVVEGEKTLRRLLASRLSVESVLLTPPRFAALEGPLAARQDRVIAFVAPAAEMERLAGFPIYQGALGLARVPPPVSIPDLLAAAPPPRLFAAMDGLANSQNVGAIVRVCAAFGAHGLLAGETGASPWLRRAVGCSVGAVFDLPVVESRDLAADLLALRRAGVRCVAAHPHAEDSPLSATRLDGDCCLVFGSEGDGIRTAVLAACEEHAAVAMGGGVDSLNVVTAAAVFLYEAARQRGRA